MKYIRLFLVFMLFAGGAYAQPLVVSVTPGLYVKDAPTNGTVTITWSEAVDQSTVNHNTVFVRGSQTGLPYVTSGTVISFHTATSASFSVAHPLKAGELVTVQLTTTITGTTGTPMQLPYAHYFFAETRGGGIRDFGMFQNVASTVDLINFVTAGDFNNDGRNDIIYGVNVLPLYEYRVMIQQTTGTFSTTNQISVSNFIYRIVQADFDGDGYLDIAGIHGNTPDIDILLNDGDATFTLSTVASVPISDIVAEDFNGDGNIDLVVLPFGQDYVQVVYGNGNGTFQTPVNIGPQVEWGLLEVGDYNADGAVDIIGALSNNESYNLESGITPYSPAGIYSFLSASNDQQLVELNGDGVPDVFSKSLYEPRIYFNLGDTFEEQSPSFVGDVFSSSDRFNALVSADINADGTMDIVGRNELDDGKIVLLTNSGGALFSPSACSTSAPTGLYEYGIAADMNGDNAVDYVLTGLDDNTGGSVRIFYNLPAPFVSFSTSSVVFSTAVVGQTTVATVDVSFARLSSDISISSTSDSFTLSTDNVNFAQSTTLSYSAVSPQTVYFRFTPASTGTVTSSILAVSGLLSDTLEMSGTSILPGVVTNNQDSGPGSLRYALENATSGTVITFVNGVEQNTFVITSGPIVISNKLTMDFNILIPGGINIDSGPAPGIIFECGAQGTSLVGVRIVTDYPERAVISNCPTLRPVKAQSVVLLPG